MKLSDLSSKYDVFLFDWDGTVCNTLAAWQRRIKIVLWQLYNIDASDKQIAELFGDWETPIKLGLDPASFDPVLFARQFKDFAQNAMQTSELYPGITEFLRAVKTLNIKTAIVTTSRGDDIKYGLIHKKLEKYFDIVVSADDVTTHKPDPEPLLHALELLKHQDTDRVLMIGDSDKDLGAANNCGVDTLFFKPVQNKDFYDHSALIAKFKPKYVVDSWRDIEI